LLAVRIYHMQRLNRILSSGALSQLEQRFEEYELALKRWNERLTSFYIRLPMLAEEGLAIDLEQGIQNALVAVGGKLERMVLTRRSGGMVVSGMPKQVENELNNVQARAIRLNKRLLVILRTRRADVYYGQKYRFGPATLKYFSTWDLIKALFMRNVNSLSVVRASFDL